MWPRHCVKGSQGEEFHKDLMLTSKCEVIIQKKGENIKMYTASHFALLSLAARVAWVLSLAARVPRFRMSC